MALRRTELAQVRLQSIQSAPVLTGGYKHESTDNKTAFVFADLICNRLDLQGKTYSIEAYKQLQERQCVEKV